MTLDELITSFRTGADDAAKPYLWPDDEVIGFLNEAEEEACIRGKLIFEAVRPEICHIAVSPSAGNIYKLNDLVNEITQASLFDSAGEYLCDLTLTDRFELDRTQPNWRNISGRPGFLIHHDKTLQIAGLVDDTYTIKMEVNRLPLKCLKSERDVPEINRVHHIRLVQWALHRAYEKPDAETLNKEKSAEAEAKFTEYFGVRPNSSLRKDENANRLHRNKSYW